jgi:hypothetical protein
VAASDEYPRIRLDDFRAVIYERDIQKQIPGVPKEPWFNDKEPYGHAKGYESGLQDYDDNPAWTEEQRKLYRAWQDTGFLSAGWYQASNGTQGKLVEAPWGPYRDTMPPTLVVEFDDKHTYVGAFDPHTGIKSLVVNGQPRTVDPNTHVWTGPPMAEVHAIAVDNHDNKTERTAAGRSSGRGD